MAAEAAEPIERWTAKRRGSLLSQVGFVISGAFMPTPALVATHVKESTSKITPRAVTALFSRISLLPNNCLTKNRTVVAWLS